VASDLPVEPGISSGRLCTAEGWAVKSPGCPRVPGLFVLLSEVRVGFEYSHGFTANWGVARRAVVGWGFQG